jgi:hypothetical protein
MCEAIYRLASWGYSLRPGGSHAGAFEAVAAAAAKRLKRTDAKGLALSYKRVEQIYQAWLRTEVERGRLEGAMVRGTWQRYAVQSLRNAAPAQVHAVGDVFKLADPAGGLRVDGWRGPRVAGYTTSAPEEVAGSPADCSDTHRRSQCRRGSRQRPAPPHRLAGTSSIACMATPSPTRTMQSPRQSAADLEDGH